MRALMIALLITVPVLGGCETFAQNANDERAEQECYEIPNTEAQSACLNEFEDRRYRRIEASPSMIRTN